MSHQIVKYIQPTPYQIDFTAVSSGKHIAQSKRRIRWVFGFANMTAISNNREGVECRGEEHEIVLISSLTTGKRIVMLNGNIMFRSVEANKTNTHFVCSFEFAKDHYAHIEVHLNFVLGFVEESYTLFIDGQSFDAMKKIFELGLVSDEQELRALRQKASSDTRPTPPTVAPPPADARMLPEYALVFPQSRAEEKRMLDMALEQSKLEACNRNPEKRAASNSSLQNKSVLHSPQSQPKSHEYPLNKSTSLPNKIPSTPSQNQNLSPVEETWNDLIDFSNDPVVDLMSFPQNFFSSHPNNSYHHPMNPSYYDASLSFNNSSTFQKQTPAQSNYSYQALPNVNQNYHNSQPYGTNVQYLHYNAQTSNNFQYNQYYQKPAKSNFQYNQQNNQTQSGQSQSSTQYFMYSNASAPQEINHL